MAAKEIPTTSLRLPKETKKKLKALAKFHKMKLHPYMVKILEQHVN